MRKQFKVAIATVIALLATTVATGPALALSAGDSVTYSKTLTIPAPPSGNVTANTGIDIWDAQSDNGRVYGLSHQRIADETATQPFAVQITCNVQSTGANCTNFPATILGYQHGVPNSYIDPATHRMYAYVYHDTTTPYGSNYGSQIHSNSSFGVLCMDLAAIESGSGSADCGYHQVGTRGGTGMEMLQRYGTKLFNVTATSTDSHMINCFDISTSATCVGQPYAGSARSTVTTDDFGWMPSRVGDKILYYYAGKIECFDLATSAICAGYTAPSVTYIAGAGGWKSGLIPMLNSSGAFDGFCHAGITSSGWACWDSTGTSTSTPANFNSVLPTPDFTTGGMGPVVGGVLGYPPLVQSTRIYVTSIDSNTPPPNPTMPGSLYCYDFATHANCGSSFPYAFPDANMVYGVTPDPANPSCLWMAADNGAKQIQSVDAFSAGACGSSGQRALFSSYITPGSSCAPSAYGILKIESPTTGWTSGTATFVDSNGSAISGLAAQTINPTTRELDLSGLNLLPYSPLPQMVIQLKDGSNNSINQEIQASMTWSGTYQTDCVANGQTATAAGGGGSPASYNVVIGTTGGGSGTVTHSGTNSVTSGVSFSSTATADSGYTFTGWVCTPSSYSTTNATLTIGSVTAGVTCNANFVPTPVINFTTGDGTGTAPNTVEGSINSMPGIGSMIAPAGMRFNGWDCGVPPNGPGTSLNEGASYHPTEDVVCVAQWTPIVAKSRTPVNLSVNNQTITIGQAYPTFTTNHDSAVARINCGVYATNDMTYSKPIMAFNLTVAGGPYLIHCVYKMYSDFSAASYSDGILNVKGPITGGAGVPTTHMLKAVYYFDGDSPKLRAKTIADIKALVKKVGKAPNLKVNVVGFVKKTKITSYDYRLSLGRAVNVVGFFKKLALPATFSASSKGIAKENTAKARRVEVTVSW